MQSRNGGRDASPTEETLRTSKSGRPDSRLPIRAERSTLDSWALPVEPERSHCHTVSYEVNAVLFQYAPNLLNILHVHASNTNAALNFTVTVLNNFELKRDTVQPENDLPAQ